MDKLTQTSSLAELANLSNLKQAAQRQDPAAIEATARRFEGLFAEMLVSSMRQTGFGDPLFGEQNSIYREFYDRELAARLTSGKGLGIGQLIRQQLTQGQTPDAANQPALPKTEAGLRAAWDAPRPSPLASMSADGALLDALAPTNGQGDAAQTLSALLGQTPAPPTNLGQKTAPAEAANSTAHAHHERFVAEVWPHAQAAARELGVDPRALVAQAALETGWGKHIMPGRGGQPSHNLFGIKATGSWQGAHTVQATHEYRRGERVQERAAFRSYTSVAESFADYVKLLKDNPRYQIALRAAGDIAGFAQGLQRAGYATDPSYAQKLKAIADGPVLRNALQRINIPSWEV